MEVSLQQVFQNTEFTKGWSFNPCFNGSITATIDHSTEGKERESFNPCFNGSITATSVSYIYFINIFTVSILVLMEVSLQQILEIDINMFTLGFNPCFNGSITATYGFTK